MALSAELQRIANRASGVFRILIDRSQVITQVSDVTRLVIGFSKKGPFNTPVFCPDTEFFQSVFGTEIDRSLERKGSYFHRTCLSSLEEGPIIALNLLKLDNDPASPTADVVDAQPFSTSAVTANPGTRSELLALFYNRDKFWFPDEDKFLDAALGANKEIFNLVNLGKSPISVLVRKSDLVGFDVSAKEWYGVGNVPEFMSETDLISDYFVDVTVVDGDFTNYAALEVDPIFGLYFNERGVIKDRLIEFLNLPEVNILASYSASLIPDFVDQDGENLFIETLINQDTSNTGLFCAIDKERYDSEFLSGNGIDLIGHGIEKEQPTTLNFLSYNFPIVSDIAYEEVAANTLDTYTTAADLVVGATPATDTGRANTVTIDSTNPAFADFANLQLGFSKVQGRVTASGETALAGTLALLENDVYYLTVNNITATASQITFTVEDLGYDAVGTESWIEINQTLGGGSDIEVIFQPETFVRDTTGVNAVYLAQRNAPIWDDVVNGIITNGDRIIEAGNIEHYLRINRAVTSADGFPLFEISSFTDNTFATQQDVPAFGSTLDSAGAAVATGTNVQTLKGSLNETLPATLGATTNQAVIDNTAGTFTGKVEVGDLLVSSKGSSTTNSRVGRVTSVVTSGTNILINSSEPILFDLGQIERYKPIDDFADEYNFIRLSGFTLRDGQLPNGTNERQNEILGVLLDTNIKEALIDKNNITFRYVIDTFDNGIEVGSKAVLSQLAKDRENAFAILNAPSVRAFEDSSDPLFKDLPSTLDPAPTLNTRYIPEGGNQLAGPSFTYSLPSVTEGASYAGFFTPFVTVRDRGRNLNVPPAAYVGNLFIRKNRENLPWSIVAGSTRGTIGGRGVVGLEYNYGDSDRDNLEPFGLNPIVLEDGAPVILGDQTAQQRVRSALSKIHVTEVVIYIQDGLANILRNYRFEFNTPQTRLEIKSLADQFMETVRSDNGVFDFQNIMNSSNNTSDIIDADMGVLDTYIEPVRGLEKLVHRTTLFRTGQISTGEFI